MATAVVSPASTVGVELLGAARRFAAITAAAAIAGVLVGGVGGRLAMLVIARLNPQATGRISDDGFRMGTFTASGSLNLLLAGLLLGLLAGAFYAVLRHLMIGPRWFRLLSISLGPAVVVGSMLVHTTGVDFTLLQPAALSIALFVALPGLAVLVLAVLAERWLAEDAWPARAPAWAVLPVLALYLPIAPIVVALGAAWAIRRALRRNAGVSRVLDHPATAWVARGGLSVVFVVAAVGLAQDVAVLV